MRYGRNMGNGRGRGQGRRGMGYGRQSTGTCRLYPWLQAGWRRDPEYANIANVPEAPEKERHKQFLEEQKSIIESQLKALEEPETEN